MVELAAAFGLFLILASFLTLALARSFSTAAVVRSQGQAADVLAEQLDKLSAVPYADLVAGTFAVPDACPGAGTGLGGDSCVAVGSSSVRVSYGFKTSATDVACTVTDGRRLAASYGYVTVNACVTAVGHSAFTPTGPDAGTLPVLSRQMNAPRPGYAPGTSTVAARLTGAYADLPGALLLLVHPARRDEATGAFVPATQVASGAVDDTGAVTMSVDNLTDTETVCNDLDPCALALSTGPTPTMVGVGGRTLALVDSASAGPGATFTVPADSTTTVTGRVSPVAAATFDLVVEKDGARVPNPVPGSVCVWVTFPDVDGQRTVPVCNTDHAGRVTLDTYDPHWRALAKTPAADLAAALADPDRVRYPFPAGTPLRVTLDHPDGSCPYAPGMVGSRPGEAAGPGGAPDDWAPLAVCGSYTWGVTSRLEVDTGTGPATSVPFTTGTTLTLDATRPTTGAIVWDNPLLAPGAVGYGTDRAWDKPRTVLGCANDASCSAVTSVATAAAVADPATGFPTPTYPNIACVTDGTCRSALTALTPEVSDCPGAYCYSTLNARPYLASPAAGTVQLTGTETSFTVDVRDTDDAAETVTAAVIAAPAAVTVALGSPTVVDAHTRRYPVTVTDGSGTTDVKVVTLELTSGTAGRTRTRPVDIGLYHSGGAWQVTGTDVTAAQGSSGVPVTVRVAGIDGGAYPQATVSFATDAPGVTITDAVTDAAGYATGAMTVPEPTSAGAYTVTATVAGTGRGTTLRLRVTAVTDSVTLHLDRATVPQGQQTAVTVHARDAAGDPVAGVVVDVAVTSSSGIPSVTVRPRSPRCVTVGTGTCTIPVDVGADADAGTYVVGGSAGARTATPQALAVTSVVGEVAFTDPVTVAQGQTEPATLRVTDLAGNPMPRTDVTVETSDGLLAGPAAGATDDAGELTVAVTAASDASVGAGTVTATVAGESFSMPVSVAAAFGAITAGPVFVDQGGVGELVATVTSGTGDPVPGTRVDFAVTGPGVAFTATATTNTSGQATSVLEVAHGTPADSYPATVRVGSHQVTTQVHVVAVPTTASAAGAVVQGTTSPVTVTVLDQAGDPVADLEVALTGTPATFSAAAPASVTDAAGQAVFAVTDTGSAAGTYSVHVTAGSVPLTVPLTVLPVAGEIRAGGSPVAVSAGAATTFEVTVWDRAGAPFPGAEVTVEGLPAGVAAEVAGRTDSSGAVPVAVTAAADAVPGGYQVRVAVGTLVATVPLEISTATP